MMTKRIERSIFGFLSLSLILLFSSCSLLEPSTTIPIDEPELYLFVQTASSGTLTPTTGAAGEYRLTLQNVGPKVLFFSDRPFRDSGSMAVEDYLRDIFEPTVANPNAALVISEQNNAGALTIALELSEPTYNPGANMLSYLVKQIGDVSEGLSHLDFDLLESLPPQFGSSELFIDTTSWHRCFGKINNNTGYEFTLDHDSLEPSYGNEHWGDEPPDTIPAQGSVDFTYRIHSDGPVMTAKFTYTYSDSVDRYGLRFVIKCHEGTNSRGHVVKDESGCSVSPGGAPFKCYGEEDSGTDQDAIYKIENK